MEPQKETPNEETVLEKDVQDTTIITEDEVVIKHSEHTELIPANKFTLTVPVAILAGFALLALAIILVVPGLKKDATKTAPDTTAAPETPTSVDKDVVKLRANDHVKGDASKAEVLLFTYSDSDCPFCAKFHPTVASVLADYKGKVAWVYRQFPLDMHPNAYTESIGMECAAKLGGAPAFFTYLDSVIDVTLTPDPKSNQTLIDLASKQGIDATAFKNCFADQDIAKRVDASIAEAGEIGARGTPFSIAVNKKTGEQVVIPGAYPLDAVKQMIDSIF